MCIRSREERKRRKQDGSGFPFVELIGRRAFTEIGKQWETRFGREFKSLILDMLDGKVPLDVWVKKMKGGSWIYQPGAQDRSRLEIKIQESTAHSWYLKPRG